MSCFSKLNKALAQLHAFPAENEATYIESDSLPTCEEENGEEVT